jgi:hypothetical protein
VTVHVFPKDAERQAKSLELSHRVWRHRDCKEALSRELACLHGEIKGVGGLYEHAQFEKTAEAGAKIAYITRQMLLADQGNISWEEARDNVWVGADCAPTESDLEEAKTRIAARISDKAGLFDLAVEIARPIL